MPPRTALFELATRRNNYVCRCCLTARGIPRPAPAQRFVQGYARSLRDKDGPRAKKNTESAKPPKDTPDKGFAVNYFEKDPRTGELTRLADEEEDDDGEGELDVDDLDQQLEDLEASTAAKAEKIDAALEKLGKMSGLLERIVEKHGPPGAAEALRKVLDSYEDEPDGEQSAEEDTEIPPILLPDPEHRGPKWTKNDNKRAILNTWINRSMRAAKRNALKRQLIRGTWKAFCDFALIIPTAQPIIPMKVWDALWTILSHDGPQNAFRMTRIRRLYTVMIQAGAPVSDERQVLAVEALFVDGHAEVALETWKRLAASLGNHDSAAANAYWELGVRMYSHLGDVARAERASKALFDRSSPSNPADSRVLLHLIGAYCAQPDTAEKGFLLYRRMRALATELEKPMDIGDYDDVISLFLTNGHTDYAMFAFTDMMFAGTVNLYGKAKLPNQLRNSFFFGKWLKKLIGAGDLDGAYNVLVFMQKHGVTAAAIQINGLIGAWLRTGTVPNRQKADRLAWAMVRSRKAFVDLRKRQLLTEWPMKLVDNRPNRSDHEGPDLDYGLVPRATVETFVILAENYRERALFTRLEELFVAYKECEMPGDAMMMNELMMAAVAQNRGDKARELYELMVHEHDILPNTDTFVILFSSLPVNLLRGPHIPPDRLAEYQQQARAVFRDMLSSSWVYAGHHRADKGCLSEAQVKLILHSFRKAEDWAGLAAALGGLRDVMHFRMTRNVLLEMLAGVEWIDRPSPRMAKAVIRATVTLQELVQKMPGRLRQSLDVNVEGVKDPHVLYEILLRYYHSKVQKLHPATGEAGSLIWEAKAEMGVTAAAKWEAQRCSKTEEQALYE